MSVISKDSIVDKNRIVEGCAAPLLDVCLGVPYLPKLLNSCTGYFKIFSNFFNASTLVR